MATTSTALVPLRDRDYIAKMTNQGTPDDLLALVTTQEAKALSDVALVTKVEAQGEVWSHVRTYINEWLVGRFPVFDELAIRIADRKRKGMSPLIIKSQPCDSFKQAIRLILECDPSYYFKIRKKHLGGGWQKSLPAEAIAPDKAGVAETSVADIKVDEPDAKDAEVCDPDPVPMPSDETVDKVHSAANETVTDINVPESEVVEPALPVTDAEVARIHEAAAADTLPEVEDQVAAEQWQPEPPDPEGIWLDPKIATPEIVANFLNGVYAEKPGRHELVREMLRLLDKCILWEISYASSEERSNRLQSADTSAEHVFPSGAAQEVLKRGGFWSAKALIREADIHVTSASCPNGGGVSLDHFKLHVLGFLRHCGEVKTRMLGRVNWYCHPDHEAALKAAKKPEGPEFHYAEGELQRGAAPQPPLVKPRAARRGQDADDANHPLSSASGKGDSAAPNAPLASPAAAPTEDETQPESATAKKPGGLYLPPIWMEDGQHGHVVGGLSSRAFNLQVRLTTGERVKVPKDGYVDMGGCENRGEVLGQYFAERRFMPDAWLNDANGAYDIATERVPPEALEFLRVLGDKPAA